MEKISCLHALFGATRLLNFAKFSYLHDYLDLHIYFQCFAREEIGGIRSEFWQQTGEVPQIPQKFWQILWESYKMGNITCKSTPLLIMALIWGFFSYIFAIAFQHFPSCTLISPYMFIRSSKKYPPYTFIWHYTFINFPKFSLLHVYLALHVYLEH